MNSGTAVYSCPNSTNLLTSIMGLNFYSGNCAEDICEVGCTNEAALNYDQATNCDNNSCLLLHRYSKYFWKYQF